MASLPNILLARLLSRRPDDSTGVATGLVGRLAASSVALLLATAQVEGVIVGGINGNGVNNAGEGTLQAFLSVDGKPAFPYWNNLVRYSDASGIYLGYNPTTMQGWVLSAHHITEATNVTVGGHNYTLIDPFPADPSLNGTRVVRDSVSTDLVLYRFQVGGAQPVPTLPAIQLSSDFVNVGEFLLMAGRGMRAGAGTGSEDLTAPFSWGPPGTSDAVPFRWGTNTILDGVYVDSVGTFLYLTDFNQPGESTLFEAQAANGDSGGGGFILRNGVWMLAGVMLGVADGPDADLNVDPSGYGDRTAIAYLAAYTPQIQAITGSLVPEPSTAVLAMCGAGLLLRRRRRGNVER